MPGNICAHTHFYGAYSRGLGIPGPPLKDFPDILEKLWWRFGSGFAGCGCMLQRPGLPG
ncbi:MAG: hypothetical protein M5U34_29465 [Chloroflexi bacterium]|nr:hypothetical protein [Chloroflexota bacterium]